MDSVVLRLVKTLMSGLKKSRCKARQVIVVKNGIRVYLSRFFFGSVNLSHGMF